MQTYTKEQKKQYFQDLRENWKISKERASGDAGAEALFNASGITGISYFSFYFVLMQMKAQNFDGLPYIDAKTFHGWKANGYKVRKGEKSTLNGITWINTAKEDEEDGYLFPKQYHLFHASQVDEM